MQYHSIGLRILHWMSAVLILIMATSGMMYFWEIQAATAIAVHQISGQILIVTLIARLIVKLRSAPVYHASHRAWERALARLVHLALYGVLFAFVVTGYVSASALTNAALLFPLDLGFARSPIGEEFLYAHYTLKWVLLALVALHIAGAFKHHLIDQDSTLSSMWFTPK